MHTLKEYAKTVTDMLTFIMGLRMYAFFNKIAIIPKFTSSLLSPRWGE